MFLLLKWIDYLDTPEDGGNAFLRNVGTVQVYQWAHVSEKTAVLKLLPGLLVVLNLSGLLVVLNLLSALPAVLTQRTVKSHREEQP